MLLPHTESVNQLPADMWMLIMGRYLSVPQVLLLYRACRFFATLISTDDFWSAVMTCGRLEQVRLRSCTPGS
jgi:hypothetical protein